MGGGEKPASKKHLGLFSVQCLVSLSLPSGKHPVACTGCGDAPRPSPHVSWVKPFLDLNCLTPITLWLQDLCES